MTSTGEPGTPHQSLGLWVHFRFSAFCSSSDRLQSRGERVGRVLDTAAAACSEITRSGTAAASCAA